MGIRDDLAAQGFFERPAAIDPALVARARDAVIAAHARGVPTVHAFLDDALWEVREALLPIARDAVGGDVVSMPAYWAWHIGPGSHGWSPHRDRHTLFRAEDGTLACVTLWVALTDATPANGCMYCVPSYWDYEYERDHPGIVVANEQHLRALPATAGTVLGWTHTLLHWGGACGPDAPPRVSASYEMVRVEVAAAAGIDGVRGPGAPPRGERAAIVEAQVAQYRHFEGPGSGR